MSLEIFDIDHNLSPDAKGLMIKIVTCFASNIPVYAGPDEIKGIGKTTTGVPALFTREGIVPFTEPFFESIKFSDDWVSISEFDDFFTLSEDGTKYLKGVKVEAFTEADADKGIAMLQTLKQSYQNPVFEITAVGNDFIFTMRAKTGLLQIVSNPYADKATLLADIADLKTNADLDDRYERFVNTNGKHQFNLKNAAMNTIAVSPVFQTTTGAENTIYWIKVNANKSDIIDLTV